MIVTRSLNKSEPDLLLNNENETLKILDLEGTLMKEIKAVVPWTHDSLEAIDYYSYSTEGWEVYLGSEWIGSSEV
ncbi:hypothetical protein [Shewanella sp. UCD-KL12]|uniref:hypothetical protein n=1 Tax=Shewanella sp. UCD-KL12 TaxID=1917163 RepID=UPI0009713AE3|nr:hypothetical protein [Shewanella sp. UCD-KL12]